jgi:pimeloyl-ACP methyl ester carboxylesterase
MADDTPRKHRPTDGKRSRRRFVQTLTTGAALAVAGCLGGDSDDDGDDEQTNETTDDNSTSAGDNEGTGSNDGEDTVSSPEDYEQRAREFAERFEAGETERAYELTAAGFEEQVPAAQLRQVWDQQVTSAGGLESFRSVEYRGENENGLPRVVARVVLGDGQLSFDYTFKDGDIVGFFINPVTDPVTEWTRPDYVDPSAVSESELTLSAPGGCELGATLSVPKTDGDVPGVVLVHGSGDQDRDQSAGPNKTFRELAQGLASQGIAVLRYDQRTVACDVDRTAVTLDDIVTDDAVTAVERLRSVEQVSEVFVAGHSLGGRVAPRVAARADTAGLVMLAPLAEPIHEAIVRQTRYRLTLDGELSAQDEQTLSNVEALAEQLRTLDIGAEETLNLGGGARGRPFWRTLQEYDHVGTAADLDVPTLLVQGGRDHLVTTEDDLPIWRDAIGDEPTTEIVVFEDLNHRFQPGDGPSRPQEWKAPENPVDERVIDRVADFLLSG